MPETASGAFRTGLGGFLEGFTMMPQAHRFPNGGGVVHRLTYADSPCRFSVWVDANGKPVDAERIDRAGRAYPVSDPGTLADLARRAGIWLRQSEIK